MRWAALIAIAVGCGGAASACAQADLSARQLRDAAFADRVEGMVAWRPGAVLVSGSRGEQALARLRDLGVKDGKSFGDAGRWYLFAAASGQAVGLNMTRDEHGWDRAGWSTDAASGLVGDAQVGIGWRKGERQASFGVIHREVKGRHMILGQGTRDDTMAAVSFTLRPGR